MASWMRHYTKVARWASLVLSAAPPISGQNITTFCSTHLMQILPPVNRGYATVAVTKTMSKKTSNSLNCACARHPWPEEKEELTVKKSKDCEFDFRKVDINPYDDPCDCKDPPPAAGCADVGKPKEVCCRSTRQYGCHCEEAEESCEEEEEEVEQRGPATCDLDFHKLEVNPYDDPCDCTDPPPAASCEDLSKKRDICCRTPKPFGCMCDAYDEPGIVCVKEKAGPGPKRPKKECTGKNKFDVKCS